MSMPTTATAIPGLAALAAGAFGGHGPDATPIPAPEARRPGMSCPPEAAEQPIATAGRGRLRRQPEPRITAQPLAPASRWRRWARRIGITLLAAGLALTGSSLIFNALTQPPRLIAPDYGSYATVGSTHVHYETWGTGGTPVVALKGAVTTCHVRARRGVQPCGGLGR